MSIDTLNLSPVEHEAQLPDDIQAMHAFGAQLVDIDRLKASGALTSEEAVGVQLFVASKTVETVVSYGKYDEEEARDMIFDYLEALNGYEDGSIMEKFLDSNSRHPDNRRDA